MAEVRDSRWTDWLLLVATVVVVVGVAVVAMFFLRDVLRDDFTGGAASSVSNAPN